MRVAVATSRSTIKPAGMAVATAISIATIVGPRAINHRRRGNHDWARDDYGSRVVAAVIRWLIHAD